MHLPKFDLLKQTLQEFSDDGCTSMSAALAYYSIFALPGLLVLLVLLVGLIVEPATVEGTLRTQMEGLLGRDAAGQIAATMQRSKQPGTGALGALIGFLTLAFGATGVMIQLQTALNEAWEVKPDPARGGLKVFITKRLLSFGMVLTIAFLLLVSLALSAALSSFGGFVNSFFPGTAMNVILSAAHVALSFAIVTVLFASMFKFLPDAEVAWKDVWLGGAVTAALFSAGKFLIGWYLGSSDVTSSFGAAGSLVLVLLWTYYSSLILLFGAEFTQVWATRHGKRLQPEAGAVKVVKKEEKRAANF